jgi:hypothetical protein
VIFYFDDNDESVAHSYNIMQAFCRGSSSHNRNVAFVLNAILQAT